MSDRHYFVTFLLVFMSSTTHATKCCNVATQVQVGLPVACRGAVQIYRQLRLVLDIAVDHDGGPCARDFNLTVDAEREPHRNRAPRAPDLRSRLLVLVATVAQAGTSGSLPTWNLGGSLAARTFRSGCRVSKPRPGPPSPPPRATTGQLLLLVSYISCYLPVLVLSGSLETA